MTTATLSGERYVVSLAGESDWVRNLRAANGGAIVKHGRQYRVRAEEISIDLRAAVLAAYLSKRALSKSAAEAARSYIGVTGHPSVETLNQIAAYYPVFKLVTAT